MFTKTKTALSVAMVLAAVGTASLARAGGQNDGDSGLGGFVIRGSTDGVNPVYHPRWVPGYAAYHGNAGDAYGYAAWPRTQPDDGHGYRAWPVTQPDDGYGYSAWPQTHPADVYGYAASPKQTHHRVSHARTRDR
jgi:hypothetical protein